MIVPNFALGAVLLMRFAAEAARYYEHAEIIELHEAGKLDAPSGTSLRTARLMAEAPGSALRDAPGEQPSRGLAADHVRIHSVRLPGVVAHQEVLFGGDDELLTLRHDSLSRRSFMSGVLLALRRVADLKGLSSGWRTSWTRPIATPLEEPRHDRQPGDDPHRHGDAVRRRPGRRSRAARRSSPRYLLDNGSDGLVVAGTTGESPTLTDDEKLAMFRTVVEAVGDRVPVVAGTGTNDTAHSIELTQAAETCGVDAVLVVTPYYNKPPERGLIAHFRAVAAATDLPVIVYNIPGRSVVNLSPEALAELGEVDNIVAVKQANPDLDELRRLRELSDLGLYAGNDDMLLDVLAMGGCGGICVASHVVGPRLAEMARLVRRATPEARS